MKLENQYLLFLKKCLNYHFLSNFLQFFLDCIFGEIFNCAFLQTNYYRLIRHKSRKKAILSKDSKIALKLRKQALNYI